MTVLGRISSLHVVPQFFAIAFVSICVVYTTNLLFLSPVSSLLIKILDALVSKPSGTSSKLETTPYGANPYIPLPAFSLLPDNTWKSRSHSIFPWASSDFTLKNALGHAEPVYLEESKVMSKAFAISLHPSNVMPYFYHATGSFNSNDITITTLITSNHFDVFSRLVEKYKGPISVTVHIKDVPEHLREVLESLHEMYSSSPPMSTFIDVHLVVDMFDRQFNTWRNIARLFSRTDFVMMLDIDFYPCTDFRSVIKRSSTISDKMYAGRAALVVPAFEYVDFHEGTNYSAFPTKKRDLLQLVKHQRIDMFHTFWAPGHNASDYKRFYGAPPGEVYKVNRYQAAYEPYVIFKKNGPPWCDERFVGYGGNKVACLFEMYLAGMSYYVLADHFIIHQNHLYEESAREKERKLNHKIYADYKEETCLHYLKKYHTSSMLNSNLAENALNECKKVKYLVRAAPKYFQSGV